MSGRALAQADRGAAQPTPWPRGASREATLSIGQVVALLRPEFPAVTVSKVRFLEDQGLIKPRRSGSGYRKYSRFDVERIRFVLVQQRDSYAPLKVIGEQLAALDAGREPAPVPTARLVAAGGRPVAPPGRPVSARELTDLTGVDTERLQGFVRLGLVSPDIGGWFPSRTVQVVRLLAELEAHGVEARALRSVRNGAERSADIIDQAVSSQRSRSRAGDLERARARSEELGEVFGRLHQEMLRCALERLGGAQ